MASKAERFLEKAEKDLYERLVSRLEKLKSEPFPSDAKRIIGRIEKCFRVRVGKYRILYEIFYDKNEILVADIDKRDRVYD